MSSLDFTLLLSPDNASRKAAEATFDAARQSHPQLVAAQLITTLNTSGDPATQELCAVLARRSIPRISAIGAKSEESSGWEAWTTCLPPSARTDRAGNPQRLGAGSPLRRR